MPIPNSQISFDVVLTSSVILGEIALGLKSLKGLKPAGLNYSTRSAMPKLGLFSSMRGKEETLGYTRAEYEALVVAAKLLLNASK